MPVAPCIISKSQAQDDRGMLRHTMHGNLKNLTVQKLHWASCELFQMQTRMLGYSERCCAHSNLSDEPYLNILSLKLELETYPESGAFLTITLVQHPQLE